ncbi:MAG: type II secretion system protein [Candidatus Gracilibacteria bacterium]|nr:type II secretion system protein [Candidatus Gracilibacteria bacterium]
MTKKGFSLVELMVVLAIIGLLAITITSFNFNKKTDIEKRDRFIQKIESMIHTSKNTMISGKGVRLLTELINPDTTHLYIGTGSVGIYYYSGTSIIGTGDVVNAPFYGEMGYMLTGAYWQNKNNNTGSINFPVEIIFNSDGNIAFSGSMPSGSGAVILGMGISYHASQKNLELDRRFGKTAIK